MALPTLRAGVSHPAVPPLRQTLAARGFSPASTPADPSSFDEGLQDAVQRFQQSVGLASDGVVGEQVWTALGVKEAGGSWLKIGLMAAAAFGLWWWWKKRRKPYNEFSKRISGYGDAVDITLIEEPLLLAERGDCEGAARLLMKRRTYVTGAATPKNQQVFKRVAQKVIASCGRDVAPLVKEAIERSREYESEIANPWDRIERKMRRKRGQPESAYRPAPGSKEEDARSRMSRLYRHGQKLPVQFIRRGEKTLYPTIRGGKVVYVPKSSMTRGPSKPKSDTQKAKQAERQAALRAGRKAAKSAANELRRKAEHYRREDGRDVLLRHLDD